MKKIDGYIEDTLYPIFFYKEMQPSWLNTLLSFLGFKAPNTMVPFSYLELACAQGINLIACAVMNPHGYFVGIDFNKQHINKAKELADFLGLKNIEFRHCDFNTFLKENVMCFDYIVNHGTYSWISPINQNAILDIVSKFLNETGLFYLHYMCYPGSIELQPIQKLLSLVEKNSNMSLQQSIDSGKELFKDLYKSGAFINYSKINAVIKSLENDHEYMAHEFLTDYWQPLYSVDVHKKVFQITKMNYIGSANPCENLDNISIPTKLQKIIKETQSLELKEYLKDLARDSKQRVDIFQKAPQILTSLEHINTINTVKFKLHQHAPKSGGVKFHTPIGEINAPKEIISTILERLSKKEMQFSELLKLNNFNQNPAFLIETIFLLMNEGYLQPMIEYDQSVDEIMIHKFNVKMEQENIRLKIVGNCITNIIL